EHQREAERVADADVAGDLAVVGVHVVHGKTKVAEKVAAVDAGARGVREDAVAAPADVVALDDGTGGVPDVDAVSAAVDVAVTPALDDVAAHHAVGGAVNVHPVQ